MAVWNKVLTFLVWFSFFRRQQSRLPHWKQFWRRNLNEGICSFRLSTLIETNWQQPWYEETFLNKKSSYASLFLVLFLHYLFTKVEFFHFFYDNSSAYHTGNSSEGGICSFHLSTLIETKWQQCLRPGKEDTFLNKSLVTHLYFWFFFSITSLPKLNSFIFFISLLVFLNAFLNDGIEMCKEETFHW